MLPEDQGIQRAALGAILLGRGTKDHLLSLLVEDDFSDVFCKLAFKSMVNAALAGGPIDYATTGAAMIRLGAEPAALDSIPTLARDVTRESAEIYVDRVRDLGVLRRFAALRPEQIAKDTESAGDAIAELRRALDDLDAQRPRQGLMTGIELARQTFVRLEEAGKSAGKLRGMPTGIYRLDHCLSGLRDGCLYVIAARPAMGKTALGINIVMHAVLRLLFNVLVFSLEMTAVELGERVVASEARIKTDALAVGRLEEQQWVRIRNTLSRLGETGLFVDERGALRITEIAATARRLHGEKPLRLVLVDYLQLARSSSNRRNESRENEVSEVSRGLKALAKALRCPVVALAQLNRDLERREDKRPRLADLRESGSIEQDSDSVIGIYREHEYDDSADPAAAELLVLKNRHGNTGVAKVRWAPEFVRFDNPAEERAP